MKTILVIDDERDLLTAVSAGLEDAGYDLIGASHGKQARQSPSRPRSATPCRSESRRRFWRSWRGGGRPRPFRCRRRPHRTPSCPTC